MRVIEVTEFGGPEVLVPREVPEPVAGAGQVLVAVAAADVLFVETQVRRGWGREFFPVEPPYVPGGGVSGTVEAAGEGVDPGWVGRRVLARTDGGGYAERVVVPAEGLVPVPDGLDLRTAAALLHDGSTAFRLFELAGVRAGEWVLVTAAGGGAGTLLVQLAHAAGAHVVAAARGERKLELLRELGAEVAVDYTTPGWAERVREATGGAGPAVVFDGAGTEVGARAFGVTADGGRVWAYGAPSGGFATIDTAEADRRGITVRGIEQIRVAPGEPVPGMPDVLAAAADGRVRPVIGQTFPLEKAADAHAAIEAREVVGKTLLIT
ncbi:MAG: zinc-binding dehydrogenase [Mycobacteriales bacterium]